MGTSFILNFRKKKNEYSKSDELSIRVRYYSDWIKDGRTLSVSTGVKCKIKDWDTDWSKSRNREPIKKTDRNYKTKNLILKQREQEIKNIISQIKWDNKIPTIEMGTTPRLIMKMTGHRSQKVFDGYYEILEKDMEGLNRNIYKKTTSEKRNNINEDSLENKLEKLKNLHDRGLIPKGIYEKKVSDLL